MTSLGFEPFDLKILEMLMFIILKVRHESINFPSFPESTNVNAFHSHQVYTFSPEFTLFEPTGFVEARRQ